MAADNPQRATISVLMPCRNAAPYVGKALASVARQDYPNVEVIVVDDGSTDGSDDIVARTGGVRLIRQENLGAAAARNTAFAASSGAYVIYFDADDIFGPRHLSALHEAASRNPGTVAMSQWARFRGTPDRAVWPLRTTYGQASGLDWILHDWSDGLPMTQCGMFLIPRPLIETFGGWDERLTLNDDFEFFCRILPRSAGMRFAPEAKLYYRAGLAGSLSQSGGRAAYEAALEAVLAGTAHILAVENSPRTRSACANIIRAFDWNYYPAVPDLRARAYARAKSLGGASAVPVGPPYFQQLRPVLGWRLARRVEHVWTWLTALRAAGEAWRAR